MSATLANDCETKRKPNFTDAEKLFLVQQYELYKPILSSRLCDGVTNRKKQEIWFKITDELNTRNPHVDRTIKDVKKKWENLATQARKEIIDYRQNSGNSTPPSAMTFKVLQLLDDVPVSPKPPVEIFKRDHKERKIHSLQVESDHSGDKERLRSTTNSAQPAIEIDAPNETSGRDSTPHPSEPSVESLVEMWKRSQLATMAIVYGDTNKNRRRRRDETKESDDSLDATKIPNDIQQLKRLKLFLETEKLMLEKKKLELEISVLSNQIEKKSNQ